MIRLNVRKNLSGARGEFQMAVELEIAEHSFVAVSGASGSGKTTLLRMLAGLTEPDSGEIIADGEVWYGSGARINRKPQERRIGFVFQEYSLFPHMTVRENLEFAGGRGDTVDELLELTDLANLAGRYPHTLSGGQKQRAALARAIAREPRALLLDEPFSTLDPAMKVKLQDEILKIHKRYNITTILVSHDMAEIYRLSSRMIMIEGGKVVRDGSPSLLLTDRETTHKFAFVGEIMEIRKADIVYTALIAAGNTVSEVVLTADDVRDLRPGDKVMVAAKAFQPVVKKITC